MSRAKKTRVHAEAIDPEFEDEERPEIGGGLAHEFLKTGHELRARMEDLEAAMDDNTEAMKSLNAFLAEMAQKASLASGLGSMVGRFMNGGR